MARPSSSAVAEVLSAPADEAAEQARLLAGLAQPPEDAARFLLGQLLVRTRGGRSLTARIVETEAYLGTRDEAAHVYRGRTRRNAPVYGPPGTLYVYFVYGMHHCLNLAADAEGVPGCVLIRAAEILADGGGDVASARGPGRLCRALAIDTRLSGRHLFEPGVGLTLRKGEPARRVGVSPRIGIRVAEGLMLRFFDAESAAVSGGGARGRPGVDSTRFIGSDRSPSRRGPS